MNLIECSNYYYYLKNTCSHLFHTSYSIYSEELMDLADEYGILIIDECPAVSLQTFEPSILDVHKKQLEALISRDKHHPSVLFW